MLSDPTIGSVTDVPQNFELVSQSAADLENRLLDELLLDSDLAAQHIDRRWESNDSRFAVFLLPTCMHMLTL